MYRANILSPIVRRLCNGRNITNHTMCVPCLQNSSFVTQHRTFFSRRNDPFTEIEKFFKETEKMKKDFDEFFREVRKIYKNLVWMVKIIFRLLII